MKDIITGIKEALTEAIKQDIRTNTVMISSEFAKMPESDIPYIIQEAYDLGDRVHEGPEHKYTVHIPPMLLGLKVFFTNRLPDEYAFALYEEQTQDEYAKLKAENAELKQQLEQIKSILGWEE